MRSVGMTKEVLSPREVADLVPLMRTDDVIHGFWTPDEGRANPVDVTMSMAKGARQRGVRIFEDTEVTDFVLDRGRVVGVRTERGDIECEKVVLAAGLWGRELAAKAGVTVPLQAAEHYYLLTEPIAGVTPESVPVIEDGEAYGYYREEGGGLLVGMFEPVGEGLGAGRHAARQRVRRAAARLGPDGAVPRGRDAALPGARGRRDPHALLRAGELHRRPLADARRVPRGGQPLPRLRPQLRRHPLRRRPRPHDGAVADRGAPAARRHRGRRRPGARVPGDPAASARSAPCERLGFLLNDLSWPNAQNRARPQRTPVAVPPPARRRRRPLRRHQRLGVPRLLRRAGRHPDRRVGLRARRGVRAHPRGAPPRPREPRDLRPVADVAPPRAGPARDGRAQPGLRQRRRHRGRPGRLHPVARRPRRDHRRRHRHPAGRGHRTS